MFIDFGDEGTWKMMQCNFVEVIKYSEAQVVKTDGRNRLNVQFDMDVLLALVSYNTKVHLSHVELTLLLYSRYTSQFLFKLSISSQDANENFC